MYPRAIFVFLSFQACIINVAHSYAPPPGVTSNADVQSILQGAGGNQGPDVIQSLYNNVPEPPTRFRSKTCVPETSSLALAPPSPAPSASQAPPPAPSASSAPPPPPPPPSQSSVLATSSAIIASSSILALVSSASQAPPPPPSATSSTLATSSAAAATSSAPLPSPSPKPSSAPPHPPLQSSTFLTSTAKPASLSILSSTIASTKPIPGFASLRFPSPSLKPSPTTSPHSTLPAYDPNMAVPKSQPGSLFLCTGVSYTGTCEYIHGLPNHCVNLSPTFQRNMTSAQPDKNQLCIFYDQTDCKGMDSWLRWPGTVNMKGRRFAGVAMSYECKEDGK